MKPKVSVIVVNFNGRKFLKDCFSSLMNLNYPKSKLEIIMVDNGSLDKSIEFVKENFPKVKILKNDINNYCRANNLGIKHAKSEYIAFLNNDTRVDRNWLLELIKAIEADKSIGVAGSKILFMDGSIESAGHQELPNFYWTDRGFSEKDTGQYNKLEEVKSLCGGAILYRKRILKDVNYFDEDFNMYLEDVDMSVRLRRMGWKLVYVPQSIAYHKHQGSAQADLPYFYTERNRLLLIAKHYPEKLSSALFGRGYFTAQKDIQAQAAIYNILVDIVLKLIKHHRTEVVKDVLFELFEELKRISNHENSLLKDKIGDLLNSFNSQQGVIKAKDGHINNLNIEIGKRDEAIKAKDGHINNLNTEIDKRGAVIQAKDEHINNLNIEIGKRDEVVKAKDGHIEILNAQTENLEGIIEKKDEYINSLNLEIAKQYATIKDIYNSTAFRYIVRPLWAVLGRVKQIIRQIIRLAKKFRGQECNKEFTDCRIRKTDTGTVGICTIISKNYLAYARVLAESFSQHNDGEIFVLLTDKINGYFNPKHEKFTLVEIEAIKDKIRDFDRFCFQYNITELNTAVKPFFLEHLFEKYPLQKLIFFDPDILITHNLNELFRLLDEFSIVITPHITQPFRDSYKPAEIEILKAGIYNLGFIGLAHRESTKILLKWWKRCLERYCRMDVESGLFVDQKWMDFIPAFFKDVFILRDERYNVAYWNLHYRKACMERKDILVNGKPVHFMHFSGFNPLDINSISRHQDRFNLKDLNHMRPVFEVYKNKLINNGYNDSKNWPSVFNYFDNGIEIKDIFKKIYWEIDEAAKHKLGNPFVTQGKNTFLHWLNDGIDSKKPVITRLMYEVYKRRMDVQRVYPDMFGSDREAFFEWFLTSGKREYGFDDFFLKASTSNARCGYLSRAVFKSGIIYKIRNIVKIFFKKMFKNNPLLLNRLKMLEMRLHKRINNFLGQLFKVKAYRPDETNRKKGVNVLGYLTAELGVGEGARASIKCLKSIGVNLSLVNITTHSWSRQNNFTFSEFSNDNPYYINLIHVNADMLARLYSEKGQDYFRNKYNIGFWFWELFDFPDEWLDRFIYCNEIWVPSGFVLKSISKKSPVPVYRIPCAVVLDDFKDVDRSYFGLGHDDFIFLFMFDFLSYFERKNPLSIIQAFKEAFSPSEKVRLIIQCYNSQSNPQAMERMKQDINGFNIGIIDRYLERKEINTLLSLCDVYISLHRSEGFGFTMAEAMFLGKPVIATGYSGNTDFMNAYNSYLVKYKLVEIEKDIGPYKKGCVWAEPDINHAAELMRCVYEDPASAKKIGIKATLDTKTNLSYPAIGRKIRNRIKEIYAEKIIG